MLVVFKMIQIVLHVMQILILKRLASFAVKILQRDVRIQLNCVVISATMANPSVSCVPREFQNVPSATKVLNKKSGSAAPCQGIIYMFDSSSSLYPIYCDVDAVRGYKSTYPSEDKKENHCCLM